MERRTIVMPWHIYCLQLADGYYFINRGSDKTVGKLIRRHSNGRGGWFTSKHLPVQTQTILQTFPIGTLLSDIDLKVNEYVLDYAQRYGYDKVRGGGYCQHDPVWPNTQHDWLTTLPE